MPEAYLRGNTIKYIRVPDEVRFEGQPLRNIREISPTPYHTCDLACDLHHHDLLQVMAKVQEENIRRDGKIAQWI